MTRFERILRILHDEFEPYPGRAIGTLQDTLSMLLALVIANTLRVPGIALALALILLLQRESPGTTFRNILQIFGGAVAACVACLPWVQLTDGTEVFRFIGIVAGIFLASFCMAGTRQPLFFTIFGFYGFVDLAGWDAHRSASAIVTSMLYNLASLGIALGSAGLVNFLFASRHPGEALREELDRRLTLLASFYRELADPDRTTTTMSELHYRVVQFAHAGAIKLNELYEELRSSAPQELPPGVHFRIGLLVRILERSSALGFITCTECEGHLRIAELCEHILDPTKPKPTALEAHTSTQLRDILAELSRYDEVADETHQSRSRVMARMPFRLFHTDAFSSPDAALFALKLTLCSTICYVIYSAVAWPGILTCVITVLFTGLSSTGAMKQKQLYRLSGAIIGGALAIAIESFLFTNMDSIASFVVVAGAVCLISAWISRSPRVGYIGVQIAFAFFITDLAGFAAAGQIAPARDRVVGIGLGILVMGFVFDLIWPTRSSDALRVLCDRMTAKADRLSTSLSPFAIANMRAEVSSDLVQMQSLVNAAWFDFGPEHGRELARSRRLMRQIESAASRFYNRLSQLQQSQ